LVQLNMAWSQTGKKSNLISITDRNSPHEEPLPRAHSSARQPRAVAVTLIELLCVMAIISILASLLLPAVLRAYIRTREFDEEMEGPGIIEMIRNESRGYCVAHPTFSFSSKDDFAKKCVFAPKPDLWLQGSRSDFVAFSYLDPTNKIVLSLHYGRKQSSYYAFTRGELSLPSE
jgi:prepilin-type N-terminal cleavage/methylation domain-containing protein